jgi:LPS sulfotransferase NodH
MFEKQEKSNLSKKIATYIINNVVQSSLFRNIFSSLMSSKLNGRLIPRTYIGKNEDYQKYIIMAHGRSGSSMLTNILGQHSQIINFSELFHYPKIQFNYKGYNNHSKILLLIRNCHPTYFLDHFIFLAYSKNIKAVGFKVFPQHLNFPLFTPVWEWLNFNKDVKVIFLTRINLLASITSLVKAEKTGIWAIRDTSSRDSLKVTLDYEWLVKQFNLMRGLNIEAFNRLRDHQIFQITYEEIISDFKKTNKSIQNFLGVNAELHKPIFKKQEVRPLSEVIANYNELRDRFINTEWINFFENQ